MMCELVTNFSGPILSNYVWWVLHNAKQKNIHTLYFLARDGYLLFELAKLFCKEFSLDIDCRYLYCSRNALRMPCYHLNWNEAIDLLLIRTQHITLGSILSRSNLSYEEQQYVCADIGLEDIALDKHLTLEEIQTVEKRIRCSSYFKELIIQKSKEAYPAAIQYFKQEGLFSQKKIAIVDSGWTGSMQRSLRQLLQSAGYTGQIVGFYFGMYCAPRSPVDGDFYTWYFHSGSSFLDRIRFSNNLFECLLAAPHGMTISYTQGENCWVPVQLPPSDDVVQITEHIEQVKTFTQQYIKTIPFDHFPEETLHADTKQRVLRFMVNPTREEVVYLGRLLFCDDVTESYQIKMADDTQINLLRNYNVVRRIWRKITHKNQHIPTKGLYWPFGTIAFLPRWKRMWYRWNYCIWEWINQIRYS